ncbi:MAG: hypothetical protein R3F30_09850 [Planctomycetota bacterium]
MRRRNRESGLTIVELSLTTTILITLIWLMTTLSMTAVRSEDYAKRISKATEACDDILNTMKRSLESSVFIVQLNALGLSYAGLLQNLVTERIIGVHFPTVDENGIFEKEAAPHTKTGNSLVFAEHYRTDRFTCSSGNTYRIPIYRFQAWYLVEAKPKSPIKDYGGFNLSMWISEPMADGIRLDKIADPNDLLEVVQHLGDATPDAEGVTHKPVRLVWKIGGDPAVTGTFRYIDSAVLPCLFDFASVAAIKINHDPTSSQLDLLNFRGLGISPNSAPPQAGIAAFSQIDTSGDGFPHGFEIQITGPASSREVLLRLSIVDYAPGKELLFYRLHVVATTRQGVTS